MSIRIHVATVYQVLDDHKLTSFGNRMEAVNKFLELHCPNMTWEVTDECENSPNLQILRSELAGVISWITTHPGEYKAWAKFNDIDETADQFIRIVAYWIANSDQRNDYVVLSWY